MSTKEKSGAFQVLAFFTAIATIFVAVVFSIAFVAGLGLRVGMGL